MARQLHRLAARQPLRHVRARAAREEHLESFAASVQRIAAVGVGGKEWKGDDQHSGSCQRPPDGSRSFTRGRGRFTKDVPDAVEREERERDRKRKRVDVQTRHIAKEAEHARGRDVGPCEERQHQRDRCQVPVAREKRPCATTQRPDQGQRHDAGEQGRGEGTTACGPQVVEKVMQQAAIENRMWGVDLGRPVQTQGSAQPNRQQHQDRCRGERRLGGRRNEPRHPRIRGERATRTEPAPQWDIGQWHKQQEEVLCQQAQRHQKQQAGQARA